jgi:hypothetical protein
MVGGTRVSPSGIWGRIAQLANNRTVVLCGMVFLSAALLWHLGSAPEGNHVALRHHDDADPSLSKAEEVNGHKPLPRITEKFVPRENGAGMNPPHGGKLVDLMVDATTARKVCCGGGDPGVLSHPCV